jgi:hypothetical protein
MAEYLERTIMAKHNTSNADLFNITNLCKECEAADDEDDEMLEIIYTGTVVEDGQTRVQMRLSDGSVEYAEKYMIGSGGFAKCSFRNGSIGFQTEVPNLHIAPDGLSLQPPTPQVKVSKRGPKKRPASATPKATKKQKKQKAVKQKKAKAVKQKKKQKQVPKVKGSEVATKVKGAKVKDKDLESCETGAEDCGETKDSGGNDESIANEDEEEEHEEEARDEDEEDEEQEA